MIFHPAWKDKETFPAMTEPCQDTYRSRSQATTQSRRRDAACGFADVRIKLDVISSDDLPINQHRLTANLPTVKNQNDKWYANN